MLPFEAFPTGHHRTAVVLVHASANQVPIHSSRHKLSVQEHWQKAWPAVGKGGVC
ncbi:hypothetical protein Ac2012v2_002626 [Leucoagaricus gongylophorus]